MLFFPKSSQKVDFARQFFNGSLVPILETLAMLSAIHYFQSSTFEKTFLAVCLKSGLILGIPLTLFIARYRWKISVVLGSGALLCSLILLQNAFFSFFPLLLFSTLCLSLFLHGTHPLQSEIYALFPKKTRGKQFQYTVVAITFGSVFASFCYSFFTKETNPNYQNIWWIASLFLVGVSIFSFRLPNISFSKQQNITLKKMFHALISDKLFAYMCFVWFLFGSANLWIIAYRPNFLSEASFGFNYSAKLVMIVLIIVPETTRMIFLPLFARLFDRINFIFLRIILNIFLALHPFFLFMGSSLLHHLAGTFCFGIAMAGSSIAWKLWLHKIVPSEKIPLYMTIHSGLTGIRMIASPLLGLIGLQVYGPHFCAIVSISLTVISILMLIPVLSKGNRFSH